MVRGKAERGRAIEKYSKVGSGEVAQWLRELATLQRTCVGLIPSTPMMAHKHLELQEISRSGHECGAQIYAQANICKHK